MEWRPADVNQPLAPFDHQVAGQSSMLRYDTTTVCKPLIAREHFVYQTLPQELKEFTPEYRGEIEVRLFEQDGFIQLYGKYVSDRMSDVVCPCAADLEDHNHQSLNHLEAANHIDVPNHQEVPNETKGIPSEDSSLQNRCMIRVLRSGSYEVCSSTEEVFCAKDSNPQRPSTHNLNPWSLKNHKRLLDKMRKSEHSPDKIRFILLKNVVADFKHPCILDLKIGSRLHGDDASHVKVASQSQKCQMTTSSSLGLRLCGMQVYHVPTGVYHSVDKYHGRTLNDKSFQEMLRSFLHNSVEFRQELVNPIVSRLSQLIECLKGLNSYRFYASSLLIIYDGDMGQSLSVGTTSPQGELSHQGQLSSKHSTDITGRGCGSLPSIANGDQQISQALPVTSRGVHQPSAFRAQQLHNPVSSSVCQNSSLYNSQDVTPPSSRLDPMSVSVSSQPPSGRLDPMSVSVSSQPHSSQVPGGHRSKSSDTAVKESSHIEADQNHPLPPPEPSLQLSNNKPTFTNSMNTDNNKPTFTNSMNTDNNKPTFTNSMTTDSKISLQSQPSNDHDHLLVHSWLNGKDSLPLSNVPCNFQDLNFVKAKDLSSKEMDGFEQDGRSSTLTLAKDEEEHGPNQGPDHEVKVDVKMIDFAHTTHQGFKSDKLRHSGPDADYIQGLENLVKLFLGLIDDY